VCDNATTFSNKVTFSRTDNIAIEMTNGGYIDYVKNTGTPVAFKVRDAITSYGFILSGNAGWTDDTPTANGFTSYLRIACSLTGTSSTEAWIPIWVPT
jgi:hypothetical protein